MRKIKKNKYYFIGVLLLLQFSVLSAQESAELKLGAIDLSEWDFEQQGNVELSGEWEFYWQQLLTPSNFEEIADTNKRVSISVPGNWNQFRINGEEISADGYGSYRIQIKVKGNPSLYIKIMSISAAYKIWADEEFLGNVGVVDTSKSLYKPQYLPLIFPIKPLPNFPNDSVRTIKILIQAVNFHHVNSGIWEVVQLGDFKSTVQSTKNQILVNALIVGVLLIIAFYYLILFFLHRNEPSTIYFSLFAFTMAIRSASVDNRIILDLIPSLDYFILIRLEYLSAYINIIFVSLFFYHLFKREHNKKIINVIVGLGIVFGLIIMFSPVKFFTGLRDVYNLYVIIASSYIAYYSLFKAILNRQHGAIPAFIGMFVMFGTAILDIITIIAVLPLPLFAPIGLVFYITIQAFVLAQRFSITFKENISLNTKLNFQNQNLENLVNERTFELKERNKDLLSAEEELRQNNEELLALNENIEQQKANLENANVKLQGQAAIAEILKRVTDVSLSTNAFLQHALEAVLKLSWLNVVNKGSIFLTDKDGNLEMVAQNDLGELTKICAIIKPDQCLCGKALASKKMIFRNHLNHEHDIQLPNMKPHGHYNIPLVFSDNVLGVLNLYVAHKHEKTKQEGDFLLMLADILAAVIQRRHLQDEIDKQTNELNEANNELQKYFVALEQTPLTIVITNLNSEIEYVNPAFTKITGYSLGDMKVTPRLLKSGKTPNETYQKMWETITKGEVWEGEFINRKKDETEFIERALIAPIKNENNEIVNYVAIKEDVTKKRENEIKIAEQHNQLEVAYKSIKDSINYAKTLQQALLALNKEIKANLDEFFLLFIPRDQVSGDFYYINKVDNTLILAVGDCTGHGVPGAFLSVLSVTYLHEIVRNQNVKNPADALEELRNRIKSTFQIKKNKDGLDIALCAINLDTNILEYSGAYNPLIIMRDNNLLEYKATNNPIGHYPNEKPFKLHKVELLNNDRIYLFSDGFIDQFGGDKNRKFMRGHFYQVLKELNDVPMNEQSNVLNEIFTKWKYGRVQLDDVTIMGIQWELKE
ncbi:MAG: SpoIIE family protein phosphatase [Bacteroidales bacterium]|nr:SpoIIE family protein phosphatase [Bacteroidales bacterium]